MSGQPRQDLFSEEATAQITTLTASLTEAEQERYYGALDTLAAIRSKTHCEPDSPFSIDGLDIPVSSDGILRSLALFGAVTEDLRYRHRSKLPPQLFERYLAKHPELRLVPDPVQESTFDQVSIQSWRLALSTLFLVELNAQRDRNPSLSPELFVQGIPEQYVAPELRQELTQNLKQWLSAEAGRLRPLESGEVFGRYRLIAPDEQAKGGMGILWTAHDTELKREVMVKTTQDGEDLSSLQERFEREAFITASLRHPNILPAFGFVVEGGRPWLAMPYIEGHSLLEAIEDYHQSAVETPREPVSCSAWYMNLQKLKGIFRWIKSFFWEERDPTLLQLLRQFLLVCDAVQHAHDKGVIHRDLKPGNIRIGDKECLVLDWGTAKDTRSSDDNQSPTRSKSPEPQLSRHPQQKDLTQGNSFLGTLVYASPEQALGLVDDIDQRSDIFCLGATLYHILTNRAPYEQSSEGDIQLAFFPMATEILPSISTHVPRPLAAICERAMGTNRDVRTGESLLARPTEPPDQKENGAASPRAFGLPPGYNDRYPDVSRFAEDVRKWLQYESPTAYDGQEKPGEWVKRNHRRFPKTALSSYLLLLISSLSLLVYFIAVLPEMRQRQLYARINSLVDAEPEAVLDILSHLEDQRAHSLERITQMHEESSPNTKKNDRAKISLIRLEPDERKREKVIQDLGVRLVGDVIQTDGDGQRGLQGQAAEITPREHRLMRRVLITHSESLKQNLWKIVETSETHPERRIRSASALAAFAPKDARWEKNAGEIVELLTQVPLTEVNAWATLFQQVQLSLTEPLHRKFLDRSRPTNEQLKLSTAVAAFHRNEPAVLCELLQQAGNEQIRPIIDQLDQPENRAKAKAILKRQFSADLTKPEITPRERIILSTLLPGYPPPGLFPNCAAQQIVFLTTMRAVFTELPRLDLLTRERSTAISAAALLRLGEHKIALHKLQSHRDPGVRSHLIHLFPWMGASPTLLFQHLKAETRSDVKQALILSLGELSQAIRGREKQRICEWLEHEGRESRDPGALSACAWALKQLSHAFHSKLSQWVQQQAGKGPRVSSSGRGWFVNTNKHTMIIVPQHPKDKYARIGAPLDEPGEIDSDEEQQQQLHFDYTYAISAAETTVEQFETFLRDGKGVYMKNPRTRVFSLADYVPPDYYRRYYIGPTGPVFSIHPYQAVFYCNWLSQREGLQKAYPLELEQFAKKFSRFQASPEAEKYPHLCVVPGANGYRLPTQGEWERACRAGAQTSRHFGNDVALLRHYSSYLHNARGLSTPVGTHKPNDWGLFDTLGNVFEWATGHEITGQKASWRGGFYQNLPGYVRCAYQYPDDYPNSPRVQPVDLGFRIVRSLSGQPGNKK